MKILDYVLTALVGVVPMFWIEDYTVTSPVWWTVVLAWIISKQLGYFTGLEEKEDETCKE